ncbi:MAG: biotin transporter BioY [Clostridia bacterium]|nr:biotin transporter BioY [Clostridia bacterium]
MSRTHKMVLVSLFAALTAVGAFLKINLPPLPFTLQIFFVIFAGLLLGSKLGFASQAIYMAVGLVGVPIFANGGGPQYVLQPSFGFLLGFAAAAFVAGRIGENSALIKNDIARYLTASAAGVLACYAIGLPYLYIVVKYLNGKNVTAATIIWKYFLLFLPWDLIKVAVASFLTVEIKKRIKLS